MKLLGIDLTVEEFDHLMCEQAKGKELKVVDGKVVAQERIITDKEKAEIRIAELKEFLKNTDYKALQFAEGELSAEKFEPIKQQRKKWREEINKWELLIK